MVSGGGSNLQAILDNIKSGFIPAEISVVIASKPGIYALERVKGLDIPSHVVCSKDFKSKEEYEDELIRVLRDYEVDLVILAGFLKVLSPHFVNAFKGRIMNIHPSLIPAFCGDGFYGERVHKAVLDYGVKVTGVTVHFVDEGTDTGPIIIQRAVEVKDDDTPDTLAQRVLETEHKVYPEAIKLYAEGRLKLKGRKVYILCEEENS